MKQYWKSTISDLVALIAFAVAVRAMIVASVMHDLIGNLVGFFVDFLLIFPVVELAIIIWITSRLFQLNSFELSKAQIIGLVVVIINSGLKIYDYIVWNKICQDPIQFYANESLCEVLFFYSLCSVPFFLLALLILVAYTLPRVRRLI